MNKTSVQLYGTCLIMNIQVAGYAEGNLAQVHDRQSMRFLPVNGNAHQHDESSQKEDYHSEKCQEGSHERPSRVHLSINGGFSGCLHFPTFVERLYLLAASGRSQCKCR